MCMKKSWHQKIMFEKYVWKVDIFSNTWLKIVKCVYKKCSLSIKKYRMCMKKSWHQKNMFEKNVPVPYKKSNQSYFFHNLDLFFVTNSPT